MRLTDKGALKHNGRHSHGLPVGDVHSCMIGGILRALDCTTEHEQLETVDDIRASVDICLPYLGTLGIVTTIPSRPFCCTGVGDGILVHLCQSAAWFPHDVVHLEVLQSDGDRHVLDYPEDKEQFETLVSRVRSWEIVGNTVFISL
jgi:hypothetical protein